MAIGATFETGLRRTLLGLTLLLPCALGFMTSYFMLLVALASLVYLLLTRQRFLLDLPGVTFLAAFLVIAIAFALSAHVPGDVLFALNFAALLFYVPLATLLAHAARQGSARLVANLALAGTAIGAGIGLVDKLIFGARRSGYLTSDPIRLADTALLLGFLSLIGIIVTSGRKRFVYLLGPFLALIAIFTSGSRGAIFAAPAMLIVAVFSLVRSKLVAALISLSLVVSLLAALILADRVAGARSSTLLIIAQSLASGDSIADRNLGIRVELYRAAVTAFFAQPWTGYGWAHMMPAAAEYLPRSFRKYSRLPHLHNDLLNFAVSGGIAGVLVYLSLLAMPIVAAHRSVRDSQYRVRLYGAVLLVVAYLFLGIPDTMVSFELHTALYVTLLAVLLGLCRDVPFGVPHPSPAALVAEPVQLKAAQ